MKIANNRMDLQFKAYKQEYMDKIESILDSGSYVLGNEVKKFEEEFALHNDMKYCVGVGNCLDALIMAFDCVKNSKPEGNEVIVPANTFIASIMGVTKNGLKAVFVEPDEYYNLDADKIEASITDKTIAICVVHLYGQLANMKAIMKIAKKYNLMVVEDCAQAHDAMFEGKKAGSFGDISCFSFYPTKNLGGFGDGGCLLTNNEEYASEFKMMRNYGCKKTYHFEKIGVNSRLDELQAGILRVKLTHLNELTKDRQETSLQYMNKINNTKILLPKIRDGKDSHVFHLFVIQVENRNEFMDYCNLNGVGVNIHYPIPPHLSNSYKDLNYKVKDFPITEKYANSVVTLPNYNGMSQVEIDYVIDVINKY